MGESHFFSKDTTRTHASRWSNEIDVLFPEIIIKEVAGVKIATLPRVSTDLLDKVSQIYPSTPKGPCNCYEVAKYAIDKNPDWSSIACRDTCAVVNGDHCINIGNGCLIDFTARKYFSSQFDVLALPLSPQSDQNNLEGLLQLAKKVYKGGSWQHFGREGHERNARIVEEAKEKALERLRKAFGDMDGDI